MLNHSSQPAEFTVRMEMASDFADIAEVGQLRQRAVEVTADSANQQLVLRYQRDRFVRETTVRSTVPAEVDEQGMTFRIRIAPEGKWETDLHVAMTMRGEDGRDMRADLESAPARRAARDARGPGGTGWTGRRSWWPNASGLEEMYRGSLADLAALRYRPLAYRERVPVGGLPWAMGLCGRDGIITCLQTMAFTPELAPATLRMLALMQGGQLDDDRDEEPGKILRRAPLRRDGGVRRAAEPPYYGAADTTPLFVVLLDEYERWSGDADLVRELRHPARMALDWIDEYGDLTGDGYLRYQRRNERHGLRSTSAGRTPRTPSATPRAAAARFPGPPASAGLRVRREAARRAAGPGVLGRPRVRRPAGAGGGGAEGALQPGLLAADREYYALALDPYGEPVDALPPTSGICCGAGSSRTTARRRSPSTWSGRGCSAAGGCAPSPPGSARTTRWARTWARCGRRTTR